MASRRKRPPDKISTKFYKCHPKTPVATVICIVCGNAYHYCDIAKLENKKDLGGNLVFCPEHVHMADLTFNEDEKEEHLSEIAKIIIAHIKMRQADEIRKEILEELATKTLEVQSAAKDSMSQNEVMVAEHTLLKQLNKELQDKNNLLNELLEKYKEKETGNHQSTKKSFAEVVTKEIKIQPKKVPKIVVNIGKYDQGEVLNTVTKYLVKEKNIQTKNVYTKNKSDIIVNCMNIDSVIAAEKVLKKKLPKCGIDTEKLNNPKIKIVGIDNYTKMDMKEIENDINARNFSESDCLGTVLHMYTNEKTKLSSVIMELPPETYKLVRENSKRLFVGHQRCMVYDQINISPCYNCGRLGHNGKKCRNKQICLKCTGNHETNKCSSTKTECTNCAFSNKTYRTNLYTNHSPYDTNNCEILKNKLKKYIDTTDYPIKPEVPTWKPARSLHLQQRADGAANAANQTSRPEVPTRNLIKPFTLNLRQRASHQSTGSISSINSPNTPPATNGE